MAKKSLKSLADLQGQIDFTEYYEAQKEAARPKNMYDLGFNTEKESSALNKNKTKHRAKQYTLEMDEEDEVEDSFEKLFNNYETSKQNKVLARNKKRYKD